MLNRPFRTLTKTLPADVKDGDGCLEPLIPPPISDSAPPTPPRALRTTLRTTVSVLAAAALCLLFLHHQHCLPSLSAPVQFGANSKLAPRLGLIQIQELDKKYIPHHHQKDVEKGSGDKDLKRIVIVGDVHGMYNELVELLEKVDFNRNTDHLVFSGDLVAKGPDSFKVVDLARKYGASCVRGNHDDRLLTHYHALQKRRHGKQDEPAELAAEESDDMQSSKHHKHRNHEKFLAKKITEEQAKWLDACPLILRMRDVKGLGEVAVVHGGLVHGISLENQDPSAVMNMKTVDRKLHLPTSPSKGIHWADVWNTIEGKRRNKYQTTVVYGHYAAMGLDIRPLTKGLDSSCVKGGRLSAFVVSSHKSKDEIFSIKCRDFMRAIEELE